jgi:ferredoxin
MQPEASFENGWCRPECSVCSQVCPAGAILPVTPEERSAIHVGTATVDLSLCVVNRDNVSCGNCHRHCPTGAIMLVRRDPDDPHSLHIPTVDEQKCIGCGACEYLCPSRPISAIKVNGLKIHVNG